MCNFKSSALCLYKQINSSFWFETINWGWFSVYIEGSHVNAFISLEVVFVLTNSEDTDEISHVVAFHLFANVRILDSLVYKGPIKQTGWNEEKPL